MYLTIKIKLLATDAQKDSLLRTMFAFNSAANDAAKVGFEAKVFSQMSIHKLVYYSLREKYGLTAQLAVLSICKASECFSRDKSVCPTFKPRSAVVYDNHIMRFKGLTSVSLASIDGRLQIPIVVSGYQSDRLRAAIKTGQADLIYSNGTFYLLLAVKFDDTPTVDASGILGVDLGVEQIAVDSEGNSYTGADVEKYRVKTQKVRDSLKSKGTKSAKRHLRKIRRKEANYRRTTNHQISRKIVDTAKAQNLSIALEDLSGIRGRTRFQRSQRARMAGWSFSQLRQFIEYKSRLAGIAVCVIDPRNTSRTCSRCGHCDKKNRKTRATFECLICRHAEHADLNAAKNIREKGYLSKPNVTSGDSRLEPVTS